MAKPPALKEKVKATASKKTIPLDSPMMEITQSSKSKPPENSIEEAFAKHRPRYRTLAKPPTDLSVKERFKILGAAAKPPVHYEGGALEKERIIVEEERERLELEAKLIEEEIIGELENSCYTGPPASYLKTHKGTATKISSKEEKEATTKVRIETEQLEDQVGVNFYCAPRPPIDYTAYIKLPEDEEDETMADFEAINNFVFWFDETYPYGEYTGDQDYLKELFKGVPIRIENNYTAALNSLNRTSANTKYILVITGKHKKKLLKEIHNNKGILKVFIIKPFMEKVLKWSKEFKKVSVLREFKELVEELKDITIAYEHTKYRYGTEEKLINYKVESDPMTMGEQTVRALRDELSQGKDQKQFEYKYRIILQQLKVYYEKRKDDKEIFSEIDYQLWKNLIELSIYFDECPFMVPGITIEELEDFEFGGSLEEFGSVLAQLTTALENEGQIDFAHHKEQFKILCQFFRKNHEEIIERPIKKSFMTKQLLTDVDICLKFSILLLADGLIKDERIRKELLNSIIVSDTRISVLKDITNAFEDDYSPQEYKGIVIDRTVLKEISVKNIVLLNTSNQLKGLKEKLVEPYVVKEYFILRDFSVDWENLEKLRYSYCYFIIDSQLTVAEYNAVIDICIKNAITPLFILYLPEQERKIAKEMFKSRWIVTFIYCHTFDQILLYLKEKQNNLIRDLEQYGNYYDNFKATLNEFGGRVEPKIIPKDEIDGGWEILSGIDKNIFNQLVEELAMGTKLVGSLHYYFLKELKGLNKEGMYWKNYAQLFGITEKHSTTLDINFGKCLLHAYTLQTDPAFYKLLNDAFRTGTEESVAKYRAFFSLLHDLVKKGILKKHIGFVYRGTYFNEQSMNELKLGKRIYSTCFTSTSKSEAVAREFARKAKRNVLLEIELNANAGTNVDIHEEGCSKYPEEKEVLLLPFSSFEIMRIFKEDNLTLVSLKEIIPEFETIRLKGIDYNN